MSPHLRRALIGAAVLLAPVGASAQEASVFVAMNPGEDRPLSWTVEERFRIGPALDGPEAFFRVYPWTITTDQAGRIYVLDVGNSVVRVFGEDGRHLREFGGKGGGPGEFVRPAGLAVLEDGTVVVSDIGKASFVRFDSLGTPLEQEPARVRVAPIASVGDELLVAQGAPETHRLVRVADGDTTTIAETGEPRMITYSGCPASVAGRPLFAPDVHWSAARSRLAVNSTPVYEVKIIESGEHRLLIRREVPTIEISRRDVLDSRTVQRGFEISWGDNLCELSGNDIVDARGYARELSPIRGLSVRPNGDVWVRRQLELDGPRRIDVFNAMGRYLGTLPDGFPFPIAWQSEEDILSFGVSEVGVPFVVGMRVVEEAE